MILTRKLGHVLCALHVGLICKQGVFVCVREASDSREMKNAYWFKLLQSIFELLTVPYISSAHQIIVNYLMTFFYQKVYCFSPNKTATTCYKYSHVYVFATANNQAQCLEMCLRRQNE